MRTLLFVTLAFAACDNNNLNNNNDDLSTNSNDDLSTMPDQAGGGQACDLIKQDCPTGEKCALSGGGGGGGGMAMPTCVTAGTVTEGQPCMRAMMGMPDNCAAGLTCSRSGGGGGGGTSTGVCRQYCDATKACPSTQSCAAGFGGGGTVGTCTPTCTPFGNDCGANQTCSNLSIAFGSTQQNVNYLFTCRAVGMTALYGDCQRQSDCPADSYCDPNAMFCTPLCDNTHACSAHPIPDAGTSFTCMSFGSSLASDPGICQ